MLAFLVLHVFGLGSLIMVSAVLGMWDLVIVNSLVFLVLIRLEIVLAGKRYTVPLPVYANGTVGTVQPHEEVAVEPEKPSVAVEPEPQIIEDTVLVAA